MFKNKFLLGLLFAAVMCLMSSCAGVYNFWQVMNVEPTKKTTSVVKTDDGLVYEDKECSIFYSFWSNGGNTKIEFHNKSNEIIYVDLSKSFLIVDGIANDLFANRTYSEASQVAKSTLTTSVSGLSMTKSSHVEVRENPIVAIPPQSSKFICGEYDLLSKILVDCDRELYPSDSAQTKYSIDNSPLVFSNYITYRVGEQPLKVIETEFYVNRVTNYAEPSLVTYKEREKECRNKILLENRIRQIVKIHDQFITIPTNAAFFIKYEAKSVKRLYKSNRRYVWSELYRGYL